MVGNTIFKEEETIALHPQKTSAKLPETAAQQASSHALFNCLIKEFALPQGLVQYCWPNDRDRLPVEITHASSHVVPLHVTMSDAAEFFVLVDRQSSIGTHYYLSHIYGKLPAGRWKQLDAELLAARLLSSCAQPGTPVNGELLKQIQASITLSEDIAAHIDATQPDPFADYAASEQNLWFGHPSHPAPKARLWPASAAIKKYSPEFAPAIQMHVLEVPVSGLKITTDHARPQDMLAGVADQTGCRAGYARISLHPVQAKQFLADPRTQAQLANGSITDLGETGFTAQPTASIRTMYVDGHDYFIKGSLNVRITNCVRKNAWYELESAVLINAILGELAQTDPASTGGLNLIEEPASISWHPDNANEEDAIWFTEQTGAILRRNFCQAQKRDRHIVAATLFARDLDMQSNFDRFLGRFDFKPSDGAKLAWFETYLEALVKPVLYLFYNHGIVLEPHLQNTVIAHEGGHPVQVLLRDYEGVKLTSDKGVNFLPADIHPKIRQSMEYDRKAGWARISYCLFVNNLGEAILAMSENAPALAQAMWHVTRQKLKQISRELQVPTPELDQLIEDGMVACKTNFKVRLAAEADRKAGYVTLVAPWSSEETQNA